MSISLFVLPIALLYRHQTVSLKTQLNLSSDVVSIGRLKEELIKELVRNDKEANHMKETFAGKVELMVKEVDRRKKDLDAMKKTLTHYEVKSQQEQQEKQKMEQEYKKKLEGLEEQLNELKRKQKVCE